MPADAPGSPTADGGIESPFVATPHADKFVYTALDGKLYYGLGANADPVMLSFEGIDIKHGEVSRDGSRLLLIASNGGPRGVLALARLNGSMPGTIAEDCIIATTGLANRAALSPGGDRVAWTDDAGLHVASVAIATQDCAVSDKRTLAPNGDYPAFSRHTMGAPAAGGGGTTTEPKPNIVPLPPPAPPVVVPRQKRTQGDTVGVRASSSSLKTALRRGLTLRFNGLKAGRTVVRVHSGRTLLARRTVRASSTGTARLTLKFTPTQRSSLRRKKRVTLRLTVGSETRTISLR